MLTIKFEMMRFQYFLYRKSKTFFSRRLYELSNLNSDTNFLEFYLRSVSKLYKYK